MFHISNIGVKHVLQRKYLVSQSPPLDSFFKQNHNLFSYMYNISDYMKTICVIHNRINFEFHFIFYLQNYINHKYLQSLSEVNKTLKFLLTFVSSSLSSGILVIIVSQCEIYNRIWRRRTQICKQQMSLVLRTINFNWRNVVTKTKQHDSNISNISQVTK